MTPAIIRLASALALLLDKTVAGRVDLAGASVHLDELAEAVSAIRDEYLDDNRLFSLYSAAHAIFAADRLSGLGWVDLLPLLHRAVSPLRVVIDAEDLDLDL